jgi:hypothetical protein
MFFFYSPSIIGIDPVDVFLAIDANPPEWDIP